MEQVMMNLVNMHPRDGLPPYSCNPTSATGYRLVEIAIDSMLALGIAKKRRGGTNLRLKLEWLYNGKTIGSINHYISKGDVYSVLHDKKIKINTDVIAGDHYISSANISLAKWFCDIPIHGLSRSKIALYNELIDRILDRVSKIELKD